MSERVFTCGTRAVLSTAPAEWRVVCATCEGGGSVKYGGYTLAAKAAVRDSNKPCPAKRSCGAA